MQKNQPVPCFNGKLKLVPLTQIELPPSNTRKQIDAAKLKNLTASIKQQGVLQPILVRQLSGTNGHTRYEIIAGERRFRAAQEAGLSEIPANIRAMDETQTLSANLTENLQREEIHPLDEADGLLRMKDELSLDLRAIAQRIAKDVRYVARRLALTNLIEEARADLRKERITLAHALEICRLTPELQPHALAACYETKYNFNRQSQQREDTPDKTQPVRHVRYLQDWIARNVHLNLEQAPFPLDETKLREDGLTCLNCPKRSGYNKTLFADIKHADTCLDPLCYQQKVRAFLQLKGAELEAKHGKPVALISLHYGNESGMPGIVGRDQFEPIERKADRCEFAEPALCANRQHFGQTKWICREATCKDHLGRVPEARSRGNGKAANGVPTEAHFARKQELFEIKVDEAVRKRVMNGALKSFAWPLDRAHLNEAIKEFFRRIPSEHQKTICEVAGVEAEETERLRLNESALLDKLALLDDDKLAQFMMLCSFAHYGANQYKSNRVDQSAVVRLSEECGVNHSLIDAEVRAELCAKKYKDAHLAYLAAVSNGETPPKPVVYEKALLPA